MGRLHTVVDGNSLRNGNGRTSKDMLIRSKGTNYSTTSYFVVDKDMFLRRNNKFPLDCRSGQSIGELRNGSG